MGQRHERHMFFFFLVLFEALLVTGRFLSPPDSLRTFSSFMMNLEKMESSLILFFESVSIWLPFSPILICLPAVCFLSCASSSIALTQSFNHASNLSTPRSQGGSFKIKIRILCGTATSKAWVRVPWHTFKDSSVFPVSERGLVYISCQQRSIWMDVQAVWSEIHSCSIQWALCSHRLLAAHKFWYIYLEFFSVVETQHTSTGPSYSFENYIWNLEIVDFQNKWQGLVWFHHSCHISHSDTVLLFEWLFFKCNFVANSTLF